MKFNLWTILLIASASQCLFLIVFLSARNGLNKAAKFILLILLCVILAINVSNIISSSYLYRSVPVIAGFARGMVLLLGPIFYLYALATIKNKFTFRPTYYLHFIPYLATLAFFINERIGVSDSLLITVIDQLMENNVPMTLAATSSFFLYVIHLLVYIVMIKKLLSGLFEESENQYIIGLNSRVIIVRRLNLLLQILTGLFFLITSHSLITSYYGIYGNFFYTLVLAIGVYYIAYLAIINYESLTPDFALKNGHLAMSNDQRQSLSNELKRLFTKEKIFINPELKISGLANRMKAHTHIISHVINSEFGMNFNSVMNKYRIEEFKSRLNEQNLSKFSILGLAWSVGFNSKSVFNKAFKDTTGLTPTQYIKINSLKTKSKSRTQN